MYEVSKVIGFLALPSNFSVAILLAGLLLLSRGRMKAGWRLARLGAGLLLALGLSPLGNIAISPLEERFPRPELAGGPAPHGIIVLGGSIDTLTSSAAGRLALNEAAERLTEAAALARAYPEAVIVFSGGDGSMLYEGDAEALHALTFFTAFAGLAPERLRLEASSRNTAENAEATASFIGEDAGKDWLLVTSAYHMPRAMALFRRTGVNVRPWPVDYRTRGPGDAVRFFPSVGEGLRRADIAAREWTALLVYWLLGRIDSPFPKP